MIGREADSTVAAVDSTIEAAAVAATVVASKQVTHAKVAAFTP